MAESKTQNLPFTSRDFQCFDERHQRSREYNRYRLRVRKKLETHGKMLKRKLKEKGIAVNSRTSLHHPYTYNKFTVDSQWVYLSPAAETWQELKKHLGPVAEDLERHYIHTLLIIGIHKLGLFLSLKIHPQAWWDGQNLKNKCQNSSIRKDLLCELKKLSKFSLKLDNWPNLHSCSELTEEELSNYFKYYIPGEHWFHLDCNISREDSIATEETFSEFAEKQVMSLIPVYRFIRWSLDNNFVFT